jgi:peptidoglycan lytic transglycosylase D
LALLMVTPAAAAEGRKAPPIASDAKAKRGKPKPKPRAKGSKPGTPSNSVRRMLTGDRPEHSRRKAKESPELKAMRELDHELFPPVRAPASAPWGRALELPQKGPRVNASGLPKPSGAAAAQPAAPKEDLSWVSKLAKPDFPVRFEPSVVRYLRYYRDNPRGQRLVKAWLKRSGRYAGQIKKLLRHYKMPEDLLWLALVESGFDSTIHSHAGAAGLWQFMPATGRIYGLTVTRSVDERLDPERSTHAALKHLKDLYTRFGTWELAFAAYNMGYGGLLASIRRFNTNDYWELRRLEAGLPYESALYVPKIMAIAIVANNCKVFGCETVDRDAPQAFGDDGVDAVSVAPGVTLDDLADASGVDAAKIAALNPQLIRNRLPPTEHATLKQKSWTIYVPKGKGAKTAEEIPATGRTRKVATHTVRWGEPLEVLAAAFGTSKGYLQELNDLYPHESPRPGTVVLVPAGRTAKGATDVAGVTKPVAVVPQQPFGYAQRRRVFIEPVFGDTVEDIARVAEVTPVEIRRWNHLSSRAKLQERMLLQLFVAEDHHPTTALFYERENVELVTVESQRFFDHVVGSNGRARVEIVCAQGDTWRKLSKRFGISLGSLERINHRSRSSSLKAGDTVVVYAKRTKLETLRKQGAFGPVETDEVRASATGTASSPAGAPVD